MTDALLLALKGLVSPFTLLTVGILMAVFGVVTVVTDPIGSSQLASWLLSSIGSRLSSRGHLAKWLGFLSWKIGVRLAPRWRRIASSRHAYRELERVMLDRLLQVDH